MLWQPCPSGKNVLCKLLFDRAAEDPVSEVYRRNPGETRGIKSGTIKKEVKWQVYKDRQNWIGKTPKRPLMFGPPSPFDWELHLQLIQNAKPFSERKVKPEPVQRELVKREPPSVATESQEPPTVNVHKPLSTSYDLDLLKPCLGCGLGVWIGQEKDVPRGV